jgi:hypothetical protein
VRNGRSPASSCPTVELGAPLHLDVVRDVTTANGPLDAVAGRFDAGIHLGEFIERDMIATRVSHDQRAAIVASLRYFDSPPAEVARDLPNHRCINICMGSGGVYRWEFDQGSKSLVVGVNGPLILDDMDMTIGAGD